VDELSSPGGHGKHVAVLPTWVLQRWLFVAPLVAAALASVLLALGDARADDAVVAGALGVGVALGLTVVPAGEGRAANPGLLLFVMLLALPLGLVLLTAVTGDRGYAAGSVLLCVLTYFVTAAAQVVRRRRISWRSLVTARRR
jgi:hypothetical protein